MSKKKEKPTGIAVLYERAWNKTVQELPDWKKKIMINNWPYDDDGDARIANEVAKDAAKRAEAKEQKLLSAVNN